MKKETLEITMEKDANAREKEDSAAFISLYPRRNLLGARPGNSVRDQSVSFTSKKAKKHEMKVNGALTAPCIVRHTDKDDSNCMFTDCATPMTGVNGKVPQSGSINRAELASQIPATDETSRIVEDGEEERQTWDKKVDFLLAIIGFAIDLGNVWRFPYVCYKNGGGIGFGICIASTFVGGYYNTIIAWAVYYLIMSLRSSLLFASCGNDWNTQACVAPEERANRSNVSVSSATEFFNYHVLEIQRSKGIEDLGNIRWQLLLCLLLVFVVVFFCCWRGTKSTGKAVWVTATLPFLVLLVLLCRGLTLPGAFTGVKYYLQPDFSRLGTLEVWVDAAAQIFFSLGPGFGALIALSSYNKFHNNCLRDAVLTSCINCCTSFFAGIVVFSVLGYMAHMQGTTVDSVATHGPGLVFIVYAEAISTLTGSVFWAIIFFLMLITLGLDSTFGGLEGVMTALADQFGFFRKRRTLTVAVVCGYCFVLGLPTVTYGGNYFIYLMDTHAAPISLLFICFTEVIAVNWFYGVRNFADDIQSMLGKRPCVFWMICWVAICPSGLLLLFLLSLIGYEKLQLDEYVYPWWAEFIGWLVTSLSILCIPLYIVYSFISYPGTYRQRWRRMTTPLKANETWNKDPPSLKHSCTCISSPTLQV